MERTREEILPGVWLTALHTDKFKTDVLSFTLLSQLQRETAAMNAAIPSVLRRGTSRFPDMDSLASELDALYGAVVSPVVRRLGEVQACGFVASFAGSDYLPDRDNLMTKTTSLAGDMLLSPNTRGGLFLPQYVESEKNKLLEKIRGQVNDKNSYAVQRLIENMCDCENFAVSRLGDETAAEAINYQKLTRRYRDLLASSPVEVFYCGGSDGYRVKHAVREALAVLPRGKIDAEIGTDIRMNAVEPEPRYFTESLDVTQGKLSIGWRLGECMADPDIAALRVFNAVFGGSVTSKLFMNVREKLSLCYYASSVVDVHKGLLLVTSGIAFDKYEAAKDEIFAQLEAIRRGEVSDEELDAARRGVASDLRTLTDSAAALEGYWLSSNVDGFDCAPEELAALCESVTREEIVAIANSVECDAVHFLCGKEAGNDD